jgi:ATP-dependent Clp protease ATP-binding subunit ClpC
MTSNIGVKKMQEFGSGIGFGTSNNVYKNEEAKKSVLTKELKNYFAPEFINRLDETIIFNTLQDSDVQKIVYSEVSNLKNRLESLGYKIKFDQTVIDFISKIGFDEVYGARPLKRAIQEKIEDFISDEVLKNNIVIDKEYEIYINESEEVLIKDSEKQKKTRKKKGE